MRGLIAIALGLVIAPSCWAQDKDTKAAARHHADSGTVCGVVAGVTVEGETVVDYKAGKAVEVDAAFLTVVGSPPRWDEGGAANKEKAAGPSDKKRENIYIVWLSPRAKVCECEACDASGKPDQAKTKACSIDRLEVGDRIEVKFARRDESASTAGANHTDRMRMKHGRDRIYSVDAREITILPAMHDANSSASKDNSKSK